MAAQDLDWFEAFAGQFVRCYWATVKAQTFPMPPEAPIEDSLEGILSRVSWTLEAVDKGFGLLMKSGDGSWWRYVFRATPDGWLLMAGTARSPQPSVPRDLLGPLYAQSFKPFLAYVTATANRETRRYRRSR